jgi:hypothetical protein
MTIRNPRAGRPRTMNAEKVLDVAMTAYWQRDPADVSDQR